MEYLKVIELALCIIFMSNSIHCVRLTNQTIMELLNNGIAEDTYSLSNQGIEDVDPQALALFNNDILDLSQNQLKYLGADLFHFNDKYVTVRFSNNSITSIHPYTFHRVQNLTSINLSYNQLETIEENWLKYNYKLTQIFFTGNKIKTIHPVSFANLVNLRIINIDYNNIEEFSFTILSSARNLFKLYLLDNKLTEIDYQIIKKTLPNLQTLSVSSNHFNCSFSVSIMTFLSAQNIELWPNRNSMSCISDETYADEVRKYYSDNTELINFQINAGEKLNLIKNENELNTMYTMNVENIARDMTIFKDLLWYQGRAIEDTINSKHQAIENDGFEAKLSEFETKQNTLETLMHEELQSIRDKLQIEIDYMKEFIMSQTSKKN